MTKNMNNKTPTNKVSLLTEQERKYLTGEYVGLIVMVSRDEWERMDQLRSGRRVFVLNDERIMGNAIGAATLCEVEPGSPIYVEECMRDLKENQQPFTITMFRMISADGDGLTQRVNRFESTSGVALYDSLLQCIQATTREVQDVVGRDVWREYEANSDWHWVRMKGSVEMK